MVVSRIDLKHVMNTYTTYQPGTNINNNLYNSYDPNLNKPNYESNYGNQFPSSNNPNYESGFEQHYTPSTPYGMNGMIPGLSSSYPNHGMPSPMMPPTYPATQRPIYSPPTPSRQTPPPPPPPPTTTSQAPVQMRPAFPVSSSDVNSICGTRHSETEITPFIYGGEDTKAGDWPWMVNLQLFFKLKTKNKIE